jgi:argininosuccinate lyase
MKGKGSKLWQGAFTGADEEIIRFNSNENIVLDKNLVAYDILGSIAHTKMLAKQGIISKPESVAIMSALRKTLDDFDLGKFTLDPSLEDVHTNVEDAVTKLTPIGKKMHTARSRNDQVLLDMRMYLRDESIIIGKAIIGLQESFAKLSKKDGMMAGYTHTRVAQPITVSFWCQAQAKGLDRDLARLVSCLERLGENPLGAGAIAGTGWLIDREQTAKSLAFDSIQENELDAISSRGEAEAELLSVLSILMARLSGLAEELIWLSQKGLINIPDSFCTGSSMMPNKRNPDVLELTRARSGRVFSNLSHTLIAKKGLILGYHSDLQETKSAVMSGISTTKECVFMMSKVISGIAFNEGPIEMELKSGFAQATEIADALARKGVPFREAHGIVGKLVTDCQEKGITLSQAKPLPQFNEKEWEEAVSLDRPRLNRIVKLDASYGKKLDSLEMRIAKAYEDLLS